jgi:glycosyltransferase involved in cell wall biosynthesis
MVPNEMVRVWGEFAGDEKGIVLCAWNPSWVWWLADCEKLPDGDLKDFLRTEPFKKWLYAPIDGDVVDGKLSEDFRSILLGFDRLLAYGYYGAGVIAKTIGGIKKPHHLPHGLDTSVFYPRPREEARNTFVKRVIGGAGGEFKSDVFLVGVVATNSQRKNWPLVFEVCAELLKRGVNVGLWVHTDFPQRYYNLIALAEMYGMTKYTIWSNRKMSDDDLAWAYSAMDVTLAPAPEGFGYPIIESLACGVSVVHGACSGGAELVPKNGLVEPIGFYGEGYHAIRRPVYRASDWADRAMEIGLPHGLSLMSPKFDWQNLWPAWELWLREGVK